MQTSAAATYAHDISINYPSTDTSYHPATIQSLTIDLDGTRYGGTLDVANGVLTVDRAVVDMSTMDWGTYDASVKRWSSGSLNGSIVNYPNRSADVMAENYHATTEATAGDNGTMFTAYNNVYVYLLDSSNTPTGNLVYKLATPITISLTPTSLTTISGENNVFASTGDIEELTYRADLSSILPANPSSDGTYILKVTVASGVATYAWVEEE